MINTFYEHYLRKIKSAGGVKSFVNRKRKNATGFLADYILKTTHSGDRILEAGAGTGVLSFLLDEKDRGVVAIDRDAKMISIIKELSRESKNHFKYMEGDLFNLTILFKKKYFAVAVSLGVIEHFSPKQILSIIKKQLEVADRVVIGMPSINLRQKYKSQCLGDELFWGYLKWKKLLCSNGFTVVDSFGLFFGKNPIAVFMARNKLISRVLARYAEFYCFVLEEC